MKKVIGIIMILIYIFSINTLVHASTMGFFSHTDNKSTTAHCHEQQSSSPEKTQSMECCAFTLSNEYSHTNIEIKHIAYLGYMDNATIVDTNNIQLKNISPDRFLISKSPGRNTNIKYNKFSDLFGIIVQLS